MEGKREGGRVAVVVEKRGSHTAVVSAVRGGGHRQTMANITTIKTTTNNNNDSEFSCDRVKRRKMMLKPASGDQRLSSSASSNTISFPSPPDDTGSAKLIGDAVNETKNTIKMSPTGSSSHPAFYHSPPHDPMPSSSSSRSHKRKSNTTKASSSSSSLSSSSSQRRYLPWSIPRFYEQPLDPNGNLKDLSLIVALEEIAGGIEAEASLTCMCNYSTHASRFGNFLVPTIPKF